MKSLIFLIPILLVLVKTNVAQDTIFMKDNNFVVSKVIEILPDYVKYKRFDNLNGPDYTVNKADVFKIVYRNGSVDEFQNVSNTPKKSKHDFDQKAHAIFLAGYTLSTLGGDALYTKNDQGVSASFGVDFPYEQSRTGFEFMLSFEEKGSKFEDVEQMIDTTRYLMQGTQISMDYITLAFSAKRFFGDNRMFYLKAGLYAGARISGDFKTKLIRLYDNYEANVNSSLQGLYTKMEAGATFGVGLNIPITKGDFPTNLVIETRYNLGLSNIVIPGTTASSLLSEDYKETNQSIIFMAGLRFPF